jgi:cyclopropane-fatty-acyl-phospholipid synthase
MPEFKRIAQKFLEQAGIELNGTRPWDIQVHNPCFYKRAILQRTLGLGESYMEGWWSCQAVDQFIDRLVRAQVHHKIKNPLNLKIAIIAGYLINRQTRRRAKTVIAGHYDYESEILLSFLDDYKQYSCAYFKDTDDLNQAQRRKLDLICRKLMLSSGDHLLDIGCGYGGLARYAAENYGCRVTGITPCSEQIAHARQWCSGLDVRFEQKDYRQIEGSFSKIVSVGMFEHVGYKNFRLFMQIAHNCLSNSGLFLLHTIGGNTSVTTNDPWVEKYIFPNGMLPSIQQIGKSVEGLFVMEDLHNLGHFYDPTLMAWHKRFVAVWPEFEQHLDLSVFRKWSYYLLHMAGSFRARKNQLWHFVFSKTGLPEGYPVVR